MSKFDILTKYIPQLNDDNFGDWVIELDNDGTPDHPIHLPFVNYSETVLHFIDDVYVFMDDNKDMELNRYADILNDNGLKWSSASMQSADVSSLNAQCVMALIMGAIRADRFCDGALRDFFKSGCMLKWIQRLQDMG